MIQQVPLVGYEPAVVGSLRHNFKSSRPKGPSTGTKECSRLPVLTWLGLHRHLVWGL